MEQTTDVQVLPLEEKIDQDFKLEIVKIIPDTESALQKLKDKYMTIKVTDKASFRKAEEARKDVKNVRIAGEKVCDSFSKPLEEQKKAWIKKKKDWSALTGEIEEYLEGQTDEWKAAEQKRKDEEAEKQENERRQLDMRLLERQQELGKMSVLFADNTFMLGEVRFSYEKVREADEEVYQNEIFAAFLAVFIEHEAERAAQEKERQEAEAKRQQEAEELRKQQEAFKKEQEEMKNERANIRKDKLLALGMSEEHGYIKYTFGLFQTDGVRITDLLEMSNDDFKWLHEKMEYLISEKRKEAEEQKERERIAKGRNELLSDRLSKLNEVKAINELVYSHIDHELIMSFDELLEMQPEEFEEYSIAYNETVANVKAESERKRQEEEEQKRVEAEQLATEKTRLGLLKAIDTIVDQQEVDLRVMSDFDWQMFYNGHKNAYEKKKHEEWLEQERVKQIQIEEKEKERLSELSENKRWKEWVEKKLIPFMADIPAFESKRYVRARAIATDKFEEIITLKPGNF